MQDRLIWLSSRDYLSRQPKKKLRINDMGPISLKKLLLSHWFMTTSVTLVCLLSLSKKRNRNVTHNVRISVSPIKFYINVDDPMLSLIMIKVSYVSK